MWINFTASNPFAVKVYVGGVNAISGESKVVTDVTKQRRREVSRWTFGAICLARFRLHRVQECIRLYPQSWN